MDSPGREPRIWRCSLHLTRFGEERFLGEAKRPQKARPLWAGLWRNREGRFSQKGRIKTMGKMAGLKKVGLFEVGLKVVSVPKPLPFSIDASS